MNGHILYMDEEHWALAEPLHLPTMPTTLTLFVEKKNKKVLYAEAGKEFVDFLCHLMVLPVGAVIRLAKTASMSGSLVSLYDSIKNLGSTYLNRECTVEFILNAPSGGSKPYLLDNSIPSAMTKLCDWSRCKSCSEKYLCLKKKEPPVWDNGYVKTVVPYMVMDDLVVMPLSTDSCIEVLSSFDLKDAMDLERREIGVGFDQVVKLVMAWLQSKTMLTDVFLRG